MSLFWNPVESGMTESKSEGKCSTRVLISFWFLMWILSYRLLFILTYTAFRGFPLELTSSLKRRWSRWLFGIIEWWFSNWIEFDSKSSWALCTVRVFWLEFIYLIILAVEDRPGLFVKGGRIRLWLLWISVSSSFRMRLESSYLKGWPPKLNLSLEFTLFESASEYKTPFRMLSEPFGGLKAWIDSCEFLGINATMDCFFTSKFANMSWFSFGGEAGF